MSPQEDPCTSRARTPPSSALTATLGPDPVGSAATDDDGPDRAWDLLTRRSGERGRRLPPDLGRTMARIERLLGDGPTHIDAARVPVPLAIELTERLSTAAEEALGVVLEEADVLGCALAADLSGLRLDELHEVTEAVLAVSRAPRAAEQWADPRDAAEADRILVAVGDDLRRAAATQAWLQDRFTDEVWDVPTPLLERAASRWRLLARAQARRQLRRVSRSGRPIQPEDWAGVLEARRARRTVDAIRPKLARHLGALDRGPLSDADRALVAVRPLRRLQGALGRRLDIQRLGRLLLADAFRSEDVYAPAVNLRLALSTWRQELSYLGRHGGLAETPAELADWVVQVRGQLPELRRALAAATRADVPVGTLRELVDLYVLREHVAARTAPPPRNHIRAAEDSTKPAFLPEGVAP